MTIIQDLQREVDRLEADNDSLRAQVNKAASFIGELEQRIRVLTSTKHLTAGTGKFLLAGAPAQRDLQMTALPGRANMTGIAALLRKAP